MVTQPPQPGPSGSESSRLAGASSNTSLIGTQQESSHQLVHRDAANAATKHITLDAHLKIVCKTGRSTDTQQHAVGCVYIHSVFNGGQYTISHTAAVRRELHDQYIAVSNREPPESSKAFVHTVLEIKHHGVVSTGSFADTLPNEHPQEWTNHVLITWEEATEAYMVEVIAAFHCLRQ